MKTISTLLLLILSVQLLSGCSNANRSNINEIPQKFSKDTVKVKPQTAPASNHSSQKTGSNVVAKSPRHLITNIVHSTIGTRYKWGGTNPKEGFDCSGLMNYVHKRSLGIDIPRTAAAQRKSSRTIKYANLQAGDMLFFKTGKSTNHVGMYIGDRKFIHAATGSKHVKVASMDTPYWHKRFIKFGTFL